jgi:universal stress protein E
MEFNSLFVVYDPTQSEQPALERAAAITEQAEAAIHVYACIHEDTAQPMGGSENERQLLDRQKETLNKAVTLLRSRGVSVTTEVEWDKDWYSAVVRASLRTEADLVLKSSYPHSVRERVLKRTSDWTLIRGCQCPVLLVKQSEQRDISKVLAAVDIRDENKSYEQLNEHIIGFSKRIMDSHKSELHFINAFDRLRAVPDRNALVKSCGVEADRVHIRMGEPEDVIVKGAKELDASLVVVGNSARSGLSAVINGNTVERVLDKLECDVLSMP